MTVLAVGLDADDTLWHNESLYAKTQAKLRDLLTPYADAAWIDARLYATEARNLAHFGYGIKGFTLSPRDAWHGGSALAPRLTLSLGPWLDPSVPLVR